MTEKQWVPEAQVYTDRAGQPSNQPKRLPEMPAAEQAWFNEGVAQGWLRFASICSAHRDYATGCPRCGIGSWVPRAFHGLWAFRGAPPDEATP